MESVSVSHIPFPEVTTVTSFLNIISDKQASVMYSCVCVHCVCVLSYRQTGICYTQKRTLHEITS